MTYSKQCLKLQITQIMIYIKYIYTKHDYYVIVFSDDISNLLAGNEN